MGSVKDLQILKEPSEDKMGTGRFTFSDRYSVFDWGEMPDTIKDKGAALCIMGACCFEEAKKLGIGTHYKGLVVDANKKTVSLNYVHAPTNVMEVSIVNVIHPEFKDGKYDYSAYNPKCKNFLIPLEVIYRNSLPEGSSVFKRLKKGETSLETLGLDHDPVPGEKLVKPIFEVSTKLETEDRYLNWKEAQEIAGLTPEDVGNIKNRLWKMNYIITELAKKAGLVNEDGKIELAYDPDRRLMLVDVLGTLDECRFTYLIKPEEGIQVSKEVARQFYKKTLWYNDVQEAKDLAKKQRIKDWKTLCKSQPPSLDPNLKQIISEMYTSTANAFLGKRIFNAPPLEQVVREYQEWESGQEHK